MKRYSYVPLRYVHDQTSGESLNVGVVLYLPESGAIHETTMKKTARLKSTFRGFDSLLYQDAMRVLRRGLVYLGAKTPLGMQKSLFEEVSMDAGGVVGLVWPDKGTQYTYGTVGFGSTVDHKKTLKSLYKRLVEDQAPVAKSEDRKVDERLWKKVVPPLRVTGISHKISKATIRTPSGPIEVQYAYKNGTTNVFQPLSFDLQEEKSITRKASTWYGYGDLFSRTEQMGMVAYLLGSPSDASKMAVFEQAHDFLMRTTNVKVYIEEELSDFTDLIGETIGSS